MTDEALPETNAIGADERAVRGLFGQMIAGWNKGSGEEFAAAFAAAFAEDGDLVAFDGTRFGGGPRSPHSTRSSSTSG